MKGLFIYYSLTGNGDKVAAEMEKKGFELRKVKPEKELSGPFIIKMLRGGFQAGRKAAPKLVGFDSSTDGYDAVVIGSPIWNSRFAAPINSVLKEINTAPDKLTFVLYSDGGSAPKAVKRIGAEYPGARIIELRQPASVPGELNKLVF